MNQTANETGGTGPSHRSVEVGVAAVMALLALIGIYGSIKVGIGWADDGPRAGFFPFYVSLIVLISCVINVASVFATANTGKLFAEWSQLRQVVSVLVPTVDLCRTGALYRDLRGVRAVDRVLHAMVRPLPMDRCRRGCGRGADL